MLTANNISLKFGDDVLMKDISVSIKVKDKIGLIGRNGAGKSTFLNILSQESTPDSGSVVLEKGKQIGFLKQEILLNQELTILQEAKKAFDQQNLMKAELKQVEEKLLEVDPMSDAYEKTLNRLTELNDLLEFSDIHQVDAKIEKVLKGLGFTQGDFDRPVREFSGGWQMRVELAKMLLQEPDFLFLDEPTNYLDILSIIWLENYLKKYNKAFILISHDEEFLDNTCRRILQIDDARLFDFVGNYKKFQEFKDRQTELETAAYKNQQNEIARKERLIEQFRAKASKAKMAKALQKELDRMDKLSITTYDESKMKLIFPEPKRTGEIVLEAKHLCKSYGDLEVLKDVNLKLLRGEKIALVGKNGTGKSTFLKLVTDVIPKNGGSIDLGYNVEHAYYAQDQAERLDSKKSVLDTMDDNATEASRTNIRSILGALLFSGEDAEKKVSVLSGGEKARLSIGVMLLRHFNFLILDEPTNHLDIQAKKVLKDAILRYKGAVLVVSHDREFLKGLTNKTVEFSNMGVREYLGDIDYFLEESGLDTIRTLDTGSTKKQNTQENAVQKVDFESQKRAKRNASNLEKKIEKLEKELKELDVKMSTPDFYQQDDHKETIEVYKKMKVDRDQLYDSWEKAMEAIG